MKTKVLFQLLALGFVTVVLWLLVSVFQISGGALHLARPSAQPSIPAPTNSTQLPPGLVALEPNTRNTCPQVLSQPDSTVTYYAEFMQNRSKNAYNYYHAKHKNEGEIHDSVVILTPISDSSDHLPRYFKGLCSLDYPHDKISVVLGEDSSKDSTTYETAVEGAKTIRPFFRRVDVVKLNEHVEMVPGSNKHERIFQVRRRKHLAKSRNKLLHAGLRDEKWVLWMDVDMAYFPKDLVQQLVSVQKHVVAPSCLWITKMREAALYDRNTWKETNNSLRFQSDKPKHMVMLEGYAETLREFLPEYRTRGEPYVSIDGVGGAVLLVYAECHRRGLIFPPFVYEHHLETEGLAKIAKDMGYEVVGLPYLEVVHA